MDALQILILILSCAAGVVLLILALAALRRDLANGRAWKKAEPEVCRAIEKVAGQRVEHRMMLNASMTEDFSPRNVFWLFLAFTRDYVILVQRDWDDDGGDTAPQRLAARRDATLHREGKSFASLTLRDSKGGEPLTVWLCLPRRKFEELSRFVHTTRPR